MMSRVMAPPVRFAPQASPCPGGGGGPPPPPPFGDPSAFERIVLCHLDAAYNLARWIVRDEHDAQDVVQEACTRAFRSFAGFRGGDARPWLLAIVRNTALSMFSRRDELIEWDDEHADGHASQQADPQELLIRAADAERVRAAIVSLPAELRTTIVLREMEGLSYKEVAAITGVPIGTVMSRLSRARERLASMLAEPCPIGGRR